MVAYMAQNHRFGVLVLAIALCLPHSVAEGREASSIGGFSLNMSSDEIASIARSRLRLKVVHSDDSLDLYNQGDDPDRSVPLAYFSYGEHGNIACMHEKTLDSRAICAVEIAPHHPGMWSGLLPLDGHGEGSAKMHVA